MQRPIIKYGVWLLFGIFLYGYLSFFRNALIDDAFITLRYVKTLLISGTWGFFPGVIANSATSPLNVLLLTFASLFTGPTISAALWLYLICLFGIAWMLARLSFDLTGSVLYGWLAVSALVFNPLLISTIGLESIVFTALFVLALYFYQFQKWIRLAIALGLLTLTRPEGALFCLLFLAFIPVAKTRLQVIGIYVLCILPWYLFSWMQLGSFVPDTFFIKIEGGTWFQWDYFNGMTTLYYYVYPLKTILSFAFLPSVILLLNKKIKDVKILVIVALAGLLHFTGYSLLKVPPFHWYYVPEVVTLTLLGSLGLGVLHRTSSMLWQKRVWEAATVICFLIPSLGMSYVFAQDDFVVREMPIHSNWGTHQQYKDIGLWLKEHQGSDTIRLEGGEIGTLSYYCDCRLLDRFSDRGWLQEYIAKHNSTSGLISNLLRINFAFYSASQFSNDVYILKVYANKPGNDIRVIKDWVISTRWLDHALVVLSH